MAPHVSDEDEDWTGEPSGAGRSEHSKSARSKRVKSDFKIIKEEYMSKSSEEEEQEPT